MGEGSVKELLNGFRFGARKGCATLLALALLAASSSSTFSAEKRMAARKQKMFELSAHRGGRGLCPENTLASFSNALAIGVTTLEMDVAVTKDRVVVISHDPHLDPNITRGPDGQWIGKERKLIKSMTLKELQAYDVGRVKPGSALAAEFPRQKPIDGTRIPPLGSVLDLVKASGNKDVFVSVELKYDPTDASLPTPEREPYAKALIEVLRTGGFANRSTIQSFDWEILQIVQRLAPEIPGVYLTSGYNEDDTLNVGKTELSKWTGRFNVNNYGGSVVKAIKAAGGTLWSPDRRGLTATQIKEAHEAGIGVIVWTVNDEDEMAKLIDMDVDGIVTDYPDILRKVLVAKGKAVAKPTLRTTGGVMCRVRSLLSRNPR
jgi:glycerophosphoryl diester phosphodiesterase